MPKLLFLSLLLVCFCLSVKAQKKKTKDVNDYFPTESISWEDSNRPGNAPKRKDVSVLYKSRAYGLLYGNPCAVDATMKMGFIYTINIDGVPGSVTGFKRVVNNSLVNLKLIFTRSPFWKLILNKKIKDCRERSGDFVG